MTYVESLRAIADRIGDAERRAEEAQADRRIALQELRELLVTEQPEQGKRPLARDAAVGGPDATACGPGAARPSVRRHGAGHGRVTVLARPLPATDDDVSCRSCGCTELRAYTDPRSPTGAA